MKFVRFDDEGKTGLVVGEADNLTIVDLAECTQLLGRVDRRAAAQIEVVLPATGSWLRMIGAWDEVSEAFQAAEAVALEQVANFRTAFAYDPFRLRAPIADPTVHLFASGSNHVAHVQQAFKVMKGLNLTVDEVLQPKRDGVPPAGFTVWPDLVDGPEVTLTPPKTFKKFDYEAECGVYVKHGGVDLRTVGIWGFTAWNDLGVRDPHLGLTPEAPWAPMGLNLPKNFKGANTCGPWVVVDEGHDLNNLRLRCLVNGEVRQDWNTADMIYDFNDILTFISTYQELRPGDMAMSGTGPGAAIEAGVDGQRWLKPGDRVEVLVDGIGTLANTIGDW